MSQLHLFKNNGYNIILDVCSGSVHVVDDLIFDLVYLLNENRKADIKTAVLTK